MTDPSASWWPSLYKSDSIKPAKDSSSSISATETSSLLPTNGTSATKIASGVGEIDQKTHLEDPASHKIGPSNDDSHTVSAATSPSLFNSYFSWGSSKGFETKVVSSSNISQGKDARDPNPEVTDHSQKLSSTSWWWTSGQSLPQTATGISETDQSNTAYEERESSWFSWIWPKSEPPTDADLDPSLKHMRKLLSEASSAIESPKGSTCHYALYNIYGEKRCLLAVEGTESEENPVSSDLDKRPLLPNENFESGMYYAKAQQESKPGKSQNASSQSQSKTFTTRQSENPHQAKDSKARSVDGIDNGHSQDSPDVPSVEIASNARKASSTPNSETQTRDANEMSSFSAVPVVLPVLDRNLRKVTLKTKARLWGEAFLYGDKTSEKHIYKSTRHSVAKKKASLTKNVVVISMHSFLPIKFVRSFIGQGTGNANQFASCGAEAIIRWKNASSSDLSPDSLMRELHGCLIHTISLDGIGTIKERVDASLKLLQNWKDEIKNADCVIFVANSIACPASAFILEKMFEQSSEFKLKDKKVGFLNMAGINTGIFPDIDSKTVRRAYTADENNILREVFDLQNDKSEISRDLSSCLKRLCLLNVKFTFCGGVNDQFVPVYSACANKIKHPNIYKCLYVQPHADVPAFVTHLMSMILTMENVGHYDDILLSELSELVQGSIASSGSHGSIVRSPEVYDTAVCFALETTSLKHQKLPISVECQPLGGPQNLYNLPWSVRGLVNDLIYVKNVHSRSLIKNLISEYRTWAPVSRQWKEVKNCFAAFEDVSVEDIFV